MKLVRFLFANLIAFIVLLLVIVIVGLWFRNPDLVNKNLPIPLPKTIVQGNVGQAVHSGSIIIKVENTGRVQASTLPADILLSSRAKRGFTSAYLWIELSLSNLAEDNLLDYEGEDQTMQLLLGVRKPQPQIVLSMLSRDVQAMFDSKMPLPSGILTQGVSWRGVIAFPVDQSMAELSLVFIPTEETQNGGLPAFEINLAD